MFFSSLIIVIADVGIPPRDYDYLYERGVKAVLGLGTPVLDAADNTLCLFEKVPVNL